ncbi:MAG: hypothetical protein C5B49_15640 [Bdellovibrio sp.]|nr:MAG: hypothetical protein C5B49_15640 [Bdellovibrio sp.]
MARLKVFLDGQLASQHELPADQDFVVGRGDTCDCVLRPERGISRQHFRVRLTDSGWQVESLSRFGELYVQGNKIEKEFLHHGQLFSAPPYEFLLEDESRAGADLVEPAAADGAGGHPDDQTQVGQNPAQAVLRLVDDKGHTRQTFSLQGQTWVCGREITCSIFIDHPKISRRQFEMQRSDEGFLIRDLGSFNGTHVNGTPVPPDSWTAIQSGDVISVGLWNLIFELRDLHFEQRLRDVDPAFLAPVTYDDSSQVSIPSPQPGSRPPVALEDAGTMPALSLPPRPEKRFTKQKLKQMLTPVRLAILLLVLLVAGYELFDDSSNPPSKSARTQTPFDKLPVEKQQLVKQAYQLARDLYAGGKLEMANQKIDEIHAIVPYYEDSKELQKYIDNSIQVQRDKERLAAQQEDERKRKEKVEKITFECSQFVLHHRETVVPEDLEKCLSPALEFDPENSSFASLRAQVDQIVADRKMKAVKAEEYRKLTARRQALYQKAVSIESSGRLLTAVGAHEEVVRSNLPDPHNLAGKSKAHIARLLKSISEKQASLRTQAEENYKSGKRREAVLLLRQALLMNPNNSEIEERQTKILAELRKDMQTKYQESILEESVGSVAEAKKKWTEIQKLSVEGEDYFEKSKVKLRKYGELAPP